MAVVKMSYTRRRGAVKAHLRYITHRPGRDNERTTRVLFGRDGRLTKDQAYALIDAAKRGTVFFRIMLSPDPRSEDRFKDLNLRDLTADALLFLQKRLQKEIHFIAAEHADHRPHRHVHLIALIQGRLTKSDIRALRDFVSQTAREQRQELDQARQATQGIRRMPSRRFIRSVGTSASRQKSVSARSWQSAPHCPRCQSGPQMRWGAGNTYQCPNCDLTVARQGYNGPSLNGGWGI